MISFPPMSVSTRYEYHLMISVVILACTTRYTHHLFECGEGPQIWQWTTQKIALILRTIPTRMPIEWLLRPQCALWLPTGRHAVMWILANVVLFRTRPNQELTLRDFIAFMLTNKYKLYQTVKRRLLVANYLCVLDMP